MSQENVEIARRAYDAFSRADWHAFVELMAPDVEFESLLLEAEGRIYRGHEGAREYFDSVRDVFASWNVEIIDIEDSGDTLVVESRAVGTGAGSGATVERRFWQAARASNGKIVWWKFFRTKDEALEAVGLSE